MRRPDFCLVLRLRTGGLPEFLLASLGLPVVLSFKKLELSLDYLKEMRLYEFQMLENRADRSRVDTARAYLRLWEDAWVAEKSTSSISRIGISGRRYCLGLSILRG